MQLKTIQTTIVQLFRRPWVQKLLIAAGAALALFFLLNNVALPLYVNHGGTLSVPNVSGLPLAEASSQLEGAGLQPVEADTRPDPDHPPGTVIYQNPPAQALVKHGRRVYLTVSGGEAMAIVPQLRGRSMRDAKFALERYGLQLGSINFEPSTVYPENTIVAQSLAADSRIVRGARINITVSSGAGTGGGVTVPNIVGKTVNEAEKMLQAQGLNVGNITYQLSYELIPNTVVEQFPRAGESATAGQKIDLFVVKVGRPTEEIQVPHH
ncbi:MAG TPA: PASTA domain-containing protein [Bacteroidota bacterium]|nr:PASTA domain-containing protein [Bacteroidota bacterium]